MVYLSYIRVGVMGQVKGRSDGCYYCVSVVGGGSGDGGGDVLRQWP